MAVVPVVSDTLPCLALAEPDADMAVVPVVSDTLPSLAVAQPLCSSADSRVTLILLKPPYKIILKLLELQVCSLDNMITTVCCVALACLIAITYVHVVRN